MSKVKDELKRGNAQAAIIAQFAAQMIYQTKIKDLKIIQKTMDQKTAVWFLAAALIEPAANFLNLDAGEDESPAGIHPEGEKDSEGFTTWLCPNCDSAYVMPGENYCSNCGADLFWEEDDWNAAEENSKK